MKNRDQIERTSVVVPTRSLTARVAGASLAFATVLIGRKCEAKLNALPQFITKIDGVDIHFIRVRSS